MRLTGMRLTLILSLLICSVLNGAMIDDNQAVTVQFRDSVVNQDVGSSEISIQVSNVDIEQIRFDGEPFDVITVGDELTISREGFPDLPLIARTLIIPPQSDVALEIEGIKYRIEDDINPVIAPHENEDGGYDHIGEVREYRNHSGYWPPHPIELGRVAIMRGNRLLTFRYYPLQYNRSTKELKVNESVDFRLVYEGIGENIVEHPERPKPSGYVNRILKGLVLNPPDSPDRDDVMSGSYLYLVPNANGVMDAMLPLIEWRKRQGHKVTVNQLQNGASIATVRNAIRDAYEAEPPVEYVAIVGDCAGQIRLPAYNGYGDYGFSRQEGDDPLPDVAVGRISCSSTNELRRIVGKLVAYESTPYMDDEEWFSRGAVVAGHIGNGLSTVLLAKYVRRLMLSEGLAEVDGWYHNDDGQIRNEQPFVSDQFDEGVLLFHYRAFSRMNALNQNVLWNLPNRRGRWPAVIAISCNTGNYVNETSYTEVFLRAQGGGIGAIGTATPLTNVKFNNIISGGFWRAVLNQDVYAFGWGLNAGKYELWRAYDGHEGTYQSFMEWNNLIGDPGTHIITGLPREIEVQHVETLSLGESRVTVTVEDVDAEAVLSDALVCLYKDDEYHEVIYTDGNGVAEFHIAPDALESGDLLVTVTKHNILPYLGEIEVDEREFYLGISDPQITGDDDDDGEVNPGENIELTLHVTNFGTDVPDGEITISAESLTRMALVQIEEDIVLDEAPDVDGSAEITVDVTIHPTCPDENDIQIVFEISDGESVWQSMVSLEAVSPRIEVTSIDIGRDPLEPAQVRDIDIELKNIGHDRLDAASATLYSKNKVIRVVQDEAEYSSIAVNGRRSVNDDLFTISTHPLVIPGTTAWLGVAVETEAGFRDSALVQVTIGSPDETDPFGPDEYGYVCYDSGDEDWDLAPEYDWIEINGGINGHDFEGTELDLSDRTDNQDESVVVDLPFDFQYYGEMFDRITVCTNGWAAFGEQGELAAFRNRHIGQALGPNAQLCVWWDNLVTNNNSEILIHHDEENDLFIIEWSRMKRLLDGGGQGAEETFQIVLYDPEVYVTETGDGIIVFQYEDVENQRQPAHNDTPYCTIGIGILDDSGGLEYTYWNDYPDGAKEIESEMAIKFITTTGYSSGIIEGTITDAETDEPVPNANVITTNGFWGTSDENGFYRIEDILANDDYSVTASALGWNDSTRSEFEVVEDETLTVDFSLLHPEFEASVERFESLLGAGQREDSEFVLSNDGNGVLNWGVSRVADLEDEPEAWEHLTNHMVGDSVDDRRIEGAVFTDDLFYITGGGNDTNYVYVFDRNREEVNRFHQFSETRFGMRDLAWDGELLWGADDDTVYGFTPDGELIASIEGPYGSLSTIAWDYTRNVLWVSDLIHDIVAIDLDGEEILRVDDPVQRTYGLAFYGDDPDGYQLYFSTTNDDDNVEIHKIDIETEEIMFVHQLDLEGNGSARSAGLFFTNEFDPMSWVMVSVASLSNIRGGDRMDAWHFEARRDWMSTEPVAGEVLPGERQDVVLTLRANHFQPGTELEGHLLFSHNASGGETEIPISVEVAIGPGDLDDRTVELTQGWNLVSLNVEPEELDIPQMMAPLVEAGLLELIKDGEGRFYRPERDFNNIPGWVISEGYKMYLSDAAEWNVEGSVIDPWEALPLEEGWNMTAYYPRNPVNAPVALSRIRDELIIAKDIHGRFYLPEFDFNNMPPLREGSGYRYKVSEDVDLVYRDVNQSGTVELTIDDPVHFNFSGMSDLNMSLLLLGDGNIEDWEVGIYNDAGKLFGSGRFDPDGRCGVSLWGDDPSSTAVDGLNEGDMFSCRIWDGQREISVELDPLFGEAEFTTDGIFVGKINVDNFLPVEFGIQSAYPNPFNSSVSLRYGLVDGGEVTLTIYDLSGREVAQLFAGHQAAGFQTFAWNANELPSGLYIAHLKQGAQVNSIKLTLLR